MSYRNFYNNLRLLVSKLDYIVEKVFKVLMFHSLIKFFASILKNLSKNHLLFNITTYLNPIPESSSDIIK